MLCDLLFDQSESKTAMWHLNIVFILLFLNFRAAQAQKQGLFEQEIVPVTTKFVEENGIERTITVTKDDGIRPGTTMAGLAKLRPAFKEDGSTTAGGYK